MDEKLLTISEAAKQLGVSTTSLRNWNKMGTLVPRRTAGGHRRYLQSDVDEMKDGGSASDCVAIYACISGSGGESTSDLNNQKSSLVQYCVDHNYKIEVILEDIRHEFSGRRSGLRKIFRLVEAGRIDKVVIESRNRLARFSYDVLEASFKSHGVEIICLESVFASKWALSAGEDVQALLASMASIEYGRQNEERSSD